MLVSVRSPAVPVPSVVDETPLRADDETPLGPCSCSSRDAFSGPDVPLAVPAVVPGLPIVVDPASELAGGDAYGAPDAHAPCGLGAFTAGVVSF